jgi:hypothetical protein
MKNEAGEADPKADLDEVEDFDEDDFIDDDDGNDDDDSSDNVGDASVEINVEELIAEIEGSGEVCSKRKREIRRKLEELAESKSFEDTYAFDFDDE